ncbi:MAG: HlyD family secretion protein [Patescibacteria group bacterium]|nr:HlyD family secretion protein [Patescibacteria group bacterium]
MKKIIYHLRKILNWSKNNHKSAIILGLLIMIGLGAIYYIFASKSTDLDSDIGGQKVSLITVGDVIGLAGKIETTGEVQSVNQAEIKAEYSAPVASINVGIGDVVSAGQVLVTLRNADLAASVAGARANLQRELSRLDDLRQSVGGGATSSYEELVKQQNITVANAYRSLLSDDLQAVPKSAYGSGEAPTISGSYNSNIEGDYVIDMYASGANSGYSFRVSGLESGSGTVKTESSVPLGTRGLYIEWPEDFSGNEAWIVSIPNKRSATYATRLNTYESAKSSRSLTLSQSNSNLKAQEAVVAQAKAAVAQAEAGASKTILRSPVSGSVVTLPVKLGEYVSPGQLIALVANKGNIQIKSYIASNDVENVKIGGKVLVAEKYEGVISRVASGIDPVTQKVEILIEVTDENISKLVIGEFVKVQVEVADPVEITSENNTNQSLFLPLRAVKLDPNQAVVFTVDAGSKIVAKVVTVGEIKGDQVEILSGIKSGDKIIASVRGLNSGDLVSVE